MVLSIRAAALYALKPPRPFTPRLQNASGWLLRRSKRAERSMTIGNYSIIYADPPWQYQRSKVQGAAENHYPTMGIDELCALPVADLAAPDSALFLWATFPQLPEALRS